MVSLQRPALSSQQSAGSGTVTPPRRASVWQPKRGSHSEQWRLRDRFGSAKS